MMSLRLLLRASTSLQTLLSPTPCRTLTLTTVCEKLKSNKPTGKSQNVGSDVGEDLKEAAMKLATSLPGDPDKTASDLLKQLRAHASTSKDNLQDSDKPVPSLGDLFSGMKVESSKGVIRERDSSKPHQRRQRDPRERIREVPKGLFKEKPLGIFWRREGAEVTSLSKVEKESLWDRVNREHMESLTRTPPLNAFEEMIQWTKEGKLWHFPINNEQGMDEETKFEFTDHIFFDELLEEFPKKGPIRHFMELVTIGLSKNPYMTVPQKHEHITWFKTYFEEKQQILNDVIGDSAQQN